MYSVQLTQKTLPEVAVQGIFEIKYLKDLDVNMGKSVIGTKENNKEIALSKVKKMLSDHFACFVLITCSEPSEEGKMDVAMDYEGDETLAAFLIENASQVFDERVQQRESK